MLKDLRVISKFPDTAHFRCSIAVLRDFVKNFALACGMAFVEKDVDIEIIVDPEEIKINMKKSGTNLIHVPDKFRRF